MNSTPPMRPSTKQRKGKGYRTLLRELSNDESDMDDSTMNLQSDPQRPWQHDYQAYINGMEQVPEDWTTVMWWGVSLSVYVVIQCSEC
jgi:hypothetical protein